MKTILFFLFILVSSFGYSQVNNPERVKPIRVYSVPRDQVSKAKVSANAQRYKRRIECKEEKNIIIFISEEYKNGKIVERKEGAAPDFGVRGHKNIVFELLADLKSDKTLYVQMNCPGASSSLQYEPSAADAVLKWKQYEVDTAMVSYDIKIPVLLCYEEKTGESTNEKYLAEKFGNKDLPLTADPASLKTIDHYFTYSYKIIPEEQEQ